MVRFQIRELDLNMISPFSSKCTNGTKLVVVGKPGMGKSTLVRSLIYNKHKLIPTALVISTTDAITRADEKYSNYIPSTFIFDEFDEGVVRNFMKRQRIADRMNLPNKWGLLLLDDVAADAATLNKPIFHEVFKMGRHMYMFVVLCLQYALDIKPGLRMSIDGIFILREPNRQVRKKLFENFGGQIPDFHTFNAIMDSVTGDYTALYIHNMSQSNDWRDSVFWYKAKPIPDGFKFGSSDYWKFHDARYDPVAEERAFFDI